MVSSPCLKKREYLSHLSNASHGHFLQIKSFNLPSSFHPALIIYSGKQETVIRPCWWKKQFWRWCWRVFLSKRNILLLLLSTNADCALVHINDQDWGQLSWTNKAHTRRQTLSANGDKVTVCGKQTALCGNPANFTVALSLYSNWDSMCTVLSVFNSDCAQVKIPECCP